MLASERQGSTIQPTRPIRRGQRKLKSTSHEKNMVARGALPPSLSMCGVDCVVELLFVVPHPAEGCGTFLRWDGGGKGVRFHMMMSMILPQLCIIWIKLIQHNRMTFVVAKCTY